MKDITARSNIDKKIESIKAVTEEYLRKNPNTPNNYYTLPTQAEEIEQMKNIVDDFQKNLKDFVDDYNISYSEHCSNISEQNLDDKLVKMQKNIEDMRTQHDEAYGVKVFHHEQTNTYIRDSRARNGLEIDIDIDKEHNSPQNNMCLVLGAVRAAITAAKVGGYLTKEQYTNFVNEISNQLQNFTDNLYVEGQEYDTKHKYGKDFYKDILKVCAKYGVDLNLVKETNYFLNGTIPLPNTSTIMSIEGQEGIRQEVIQTSTPVTHLSKKQHALYAHVANLSEEEVRNGEIGDISALQEDGITAEDFIFFTSQHPNIRVLIHGHGSLMIDGNHQVQTELVQYLVGPRNLNIKDDYIKDDAGNLECVGERTDLPAIAYIGPGEEKYQIRATMDNIESTIEVIGTPYIITNFVTPQSLTSGKDRKLPKITEEAVNRLRDEEGYSVQFANTPYNLQRITSKNKQKPIEQSAQQYAGLISEILTAERDITPETMQLNLDKINKYFKDIEKKGKSSSEALKEAREALDTWKGGLTDAELTRLAPFLSDVGMAIDLNERLKGPTDLKLFKANKLFSLENNNLELSTDFTTLGNNIAGGFPGVGEEINRITIENSIIDSIKGLKEQIIVRTALRNRDFETAKLLAPKTAAYIDILAEGDRKELQEKASEINENLKNLPLIGTGCASNIDRGGLCIVESFVKNMFKNLQQKLGFKNLQPELDNITETVVAANVNINPQYNTHPGTAGVKKGTTTASLPAQDVHYQNTAHITAAQHPLKIKKDKDISKTYKLAAQIHEVKEQIETNYEDIDKYVIKGDNIHAMQLCKRQGELVDKLEKLSKEEEKQGSIIVGSSKDDIEALRTVTLGKKEAVEQSIRSKQEAGNILDKGEEKILAAAVKTNILDKIFASPSMKWEQRIKAEREMSEKGHGRG